MAASVLSRGGSAPACSRRYIPALNGVRAILALGVLLCHLKYDIQRLPGGNLVFPFLDLEYRRVELFYLLSGFTLSLVYWDRFRAFSLEIYREFMTKRVLRLAPLHWVMLWVAGAMFLAAGSPADPRYTAGSFAAHIFLVQGWFARDAWNPPAWFLTLELLGSAALPLIVATRAERLPRWLSGAAAIALYGSLWVFPVGNQHLLRLGLAFPAGALLYCWYRASGFRAPRFGRPADRVLSRPFFQWLGTRSFSLFMTHILTLRIIKRAVPLAGDWSHLAIWFAACLAVAEISYRWVETPIQRFIETPRRKPALVPLRVAA